MSSWKVHADVDIYFITSAIESWLPVFIEESYFEIITNSLRHCVMNKRLIIHGYVIMPNHIHLLVNGQGNLPGIMRDFKTFTSSQISKELLANRYIDWLKIFCISASKSKKNDNYKIWQNGYHPIGIYSGKFCRQKLNYIHQNPVKKGLVEKPEHWFYSSARNYAGSTNYPMEIVML